MIDSGSNRNLFWAYPARRAGIKLEKGIRREIYGIGQNKPLLAYTHKTKIILNQIGLIEVEIDYCDEQRINLFGINGFFDKFKSVTIDAVNKTTSIAT